MDKNCKQCSTHFKINQQDLDFYDKVSPIFAGKKYLIPTPTLCPQCRQQRRMAFRNERQLYHRKCDLTGRQMISMYRREAPFPVYSPESWFSDKWDACDYGREFDFSRPFFEQFLELRNEVPHLSLISHKNENSDFCNIVGMSKNCYLLYGSVNCEDCYYGNPYNSKDCVDSLILRDAELCFQCIDSDKLYNCSYCQNCSNSRGLSLCFEVNNSEDCFGCVGLNRKKYCIFNQQYTKEEYESKMKPVDFGDSKVWEWAFAKFDQLKLSMPHKYYVGTNNENVSGNYIFNSQNCADVYYVKACQDVVRGLQLLDVKDSMDIENGEYGELNYDVMAFYNNVSRVSFSYFVWGNISNLLYCGQCTQGVKDCFGSVGLRGSQYCILNKQYTKEDYQVLVPRIIEHMRQTGEWGEFFPITFSPFAYNESIASEYFNLSREEVISSGWQWLDDHSEKIYRGGKYQIPNKIDDVSDDVCKNILVCEKSGKLYKIIPQELEFYRRMHVPIPKCSPNQRHYDRMSLRTPCKLWARECDSCAVQIDSSYAPERAEKVYCEKCYLANIF